MSSTRRWLVDSGSAWDLVDASHVKHLKGLIRTPQYCPRLWTANGITSVDREVPLYLPELNEECVPFVMKDTPDVLTMGRRCMNEGYSFVWKANSDKPYFRKPDGTRVVMKVENYVPYLVTNLEESAAAPVSSDEEFGKAGGATAWPTAPVEKHTPPGSDASASDGGAPPGSGASASDGGMASGSSTSVPDDGGRLTEHASPAGADQGVLDALVTEGLVAGSGSALDARPPHRQTAGSSEGKSDATTSDSIGAGSSSVPDAQRTRKATAGSGSLASSAAGGIPPARDVDHEVEFFPAMALSMNPSRTLKMRVKKTTRSLSPDETWSRRQNR